MTSHQPPPAPVTTNWDWQLHGACRDTGDEPLFHPPGERRRHRARRIAEAKAICAQCPVITRCREHALAAVEPYGTWGGLSEDERAAILGRQSLNYPARRPDRILPGTGTPAASPTRPTTQLIGATG